MSGSGDSERSRIAVLERPLYTVAEAAHLLRLRPDKVRRWLDGYHRAGTFYEPVIRVQKTGSDEVTWGEFVQLGYLREFRHARVPLQSLRPFVVMLREELDVAYPLAHEGTYLGEHRWLVLAIQRRSGVDESLFMVTHPRKTGQLIIPQVKPTLRLSKPVEQFLQRVEFDGHAARRWLPFGQGSRVVVDPQQTFGIPNIRGVRTEVLADGFYGGESVEDLAEGYGLDRAAVEEAIRWERHGSEEAA